MKHPVGSPILASLALAATLTLPATAQAGGCPNEASRTGRSASLPDCRAYELVTPEDLGSSEAVTFTGSDRAAVAADGEAVALETISTLEPDPTPLGGRDVMSRTAHGWTIRSAVAPGYGGLFVDMRLFSPDLSLVGVDTRDPYNPFVEGETTLDVGPVGGPYTRIADIPAGTPEVRGANNRLAGANEGTESVPAFSVVLFESTDHELLSPGRERELVEGAPAGEVELYESSDAGTRLVNVEGQGASMKLVEEGVNCGVQLGAYSATLSKVSTGGSIGAVSNDGSKVFFTTSVRKNNFECEHQPSRLWMRVGGRETVEVSAPEQGVTLEASERSEVFFKMATADGSKVFFETATPLTAGESPSEKTALKVFMYDTNTRSLTLVGVGVNVHSGGTNGEPFGVLPSADGSTVYYNGTGADGEGVYRYDVATGARRFVARILHGPTKGVEPVYTTPNGEFLVFAAVGVETLGPHGLEVEPRGNDASGETELYRFDALDGSVTCVSCGEGAVAPTGEVKVTESYFETNQETAPFIQMSEDGQRVFFETTAQLVPQDTNNTEGPNSRPTSGSGLDVYEWEADGAEEGPGVFCRVVVGCVHLISAGEAVGGEHFLGASRSGRDLFFSSGAQLLPQATPEDSNIYDARVDGGFPRLAKAPECTSCQGVGSPTPLFGAPASATFQGAGNPPLVPLVTAKPKPKSKPKAKPACKRGFVRGKHGRCVRARGKKAGVSGGRVSRREGR